MVAQSRKGELKWTQARNSSESFLSQTPKYNSIIFLLTLGIAGGLLYLAINLSAKKSAAVGGNFAYLSDEFDNGYPEKRFDFVLRAFGQFFGPQVEKAGGHLRIVKDWNDGAVNAWGWKEGNAWFLEVPGGISRYSLINEEAFVSVLCHELGHLMGGAPTNGSSGTISVEGQADFYSVQKCFRAFADKIAPFYPLKIDMGGRDQEIQAVCQRNQDAKLCESALLGALSLTGYYASIEDKPAPYLLQPDLSVVSSTLEMHPSAQCRLDTMLASTLCPVSPADEISWQDPTVGYCHQLLHPEFARPRCWFAN